MYDPVVIGHDMEKFGGSLQEAELSSVCSTRMFYSQRPGVHPRGQKIQGVSGREVR